LRPAPCSWQPNPGARDTVIGAALSREGWC
jgi:hypothetical protein